MVTEPVVTVSVAEEPDLPQPPTSASTGGTSPRWEVASLDAIKAVVGSVVAPGSVPFGFRRLESILLFGKHVRQVFGDGEQVFQIHQSPKARITAKSGYLSTLTVGGREAYLLRGAWTTMGGGPWRWDPAIGSSVLVQVGDWAVEVSSYGKAKIDSEALLRIAESLALY